MAWLGFSSDYNQFYDEFDRQIRKRLEVKRAIAQLIARTELSRAGQLSSAQLAKFKIWKSSAQLSSPNSKSEKARLSSARQFELVSSARFSELKNEPKK